VEKIFKIRRKGGGNIKAETCLGGRDDQAGGVEKETSEARFLTKKPVQTEIAVLVVPQNRSSCHCKMAADLVHPAGTQFQFQERAGFTGAEAPAKQPEKGFRGPGFAPAFQIQADAPLFRLRIPRTAGKVALYQAVFFPCGKDSGKEGSRFPVFCHEYEPRGILIKPVRQVEGTAIFLFKKTIKRVLYPLPALNRKTGRFIEHETEIIFKKYFQILQFFPFFFPRGLFLPKIKL
jgi:hypothetical protein